MGHDKFWLPKKESVEKLEESGEYRLIIHRRPGLGIFFENANSSTPKFAEIYCEIVWFGFWRIPLFM